jgi:hypothetical protein
MHTEGHKRPPEVAACAGKVAKCASHASVFRRKAYAYKSAGRRRTSGESECPPEDSLRKRKVAEFLSKGLTLAKKVSSSQRGNGRLQKTGNVSARRRTALSMPGHIRSLSVSIPAALWTAGITSSDKSVTTAWTSPPLRRTLARTIEAVANDGADGHTEREEDWDVHEEKQSEIARAETRRGSVRPHKKMNRSDTDQYTSESSDADAQ